MRILAGTVVLMAATACGNGGGDGLAEASDSGLQTARVSVLRSTLGTVLYGLAEEGGHFEDNGIAVEYVEMSDEANMIAGQQLLRGTFDFYFGATADVANVTAAAVANGQEPPVKIIAATTAGSSDGDDGFTHLVLAEGTQFDSVADLRGMTIAVPSASSGHIPVFRQYLERESTSIEELEINLLSVPNDQTLAALEGRRLQGFLGSQPNVATAVLKLNAQDMLSGKDLCDLCPDIPGDAIGVATEFLADDDNRAVAERVIQSFQDATDALETMPKDEVVDIYASYTGGERDAMSEAYDHFSPGVVPIEKAKRAYFDVTGAFNISTGAWPAELTADDLFDTTISD